MIELPKNTKEQNTMQFEELINLWMTEKQYYIIKHRTYLRYNEIIKTHISPALGSVEIGNLTISLIQDFQKREFTNGNKKTMQPLANNTVKNIMSIVRNSILYGIREKGLNIINPNDLHPPTFEQKPVQVFDRAEQKRIEQAVLNGKPNHFGIVLCLYTGLRLGELLALTWKDIDFKNSVLTVDKTSCFIKDEDGEYKCLVSKPKTQSSVRMIPLPKSILAELKAIRKKSISEYVISTHSGEHVSNRSYQTTYARILKKAKVRYRNFHVLRHTFATRALECGTDIKTVSEILGHKSPVITMNRYVHSMFDTKRKMAETLAKQLDFGDKKKSTV